MPKHPTTWRKTILIPLWTIRIILILFIITAYGIVLRTIHTKNNHSSFGDKHVNVTEGAQITFLILLLIIFLLDILIITLFSLPSLTLTPTTFLVINAIQTAFWTAVLILDCVEMGKGASASGVGVTVVIWLSFVAGLVYAVVVYRRERRLAGRGCYAPTHNPAAWASAVRSETSYVDMVSDQQRTAYDDLQIKAASELQSVHTQGHGKADEYYTVQSTKAAQTV